MPPRKDLIAATIASTLLSQTALAESSPPRQDAVIVVSGDGIVHAVPDGAVIQAGVATIAATAHEAMDINGSTMTAVIAAAKSAGISEPDLQTSELSVQPQYSDKTAKGEAKIVAYQVISRLSIRVRGRNRVGRLIDAVTSAGANQMYGLNFEVLEIQDYADLARKAAVADAQRKAELYAQAAGVRLGRLISLSENSAQSGPRPLMRQAAAQTAMPVESGEIDVAAQITATFELSDK
jgi:uncharacterized protein